MHNSSWVSFLVVATLVVMVTALIAAIRAKKRDQVVVPFLATFLISCVVYPTTVDGADSFLTAIVVCTLAAATISALLIRFQPSRSKLATASWAMLGVVMPYVAFFALLTAACAGKSECLG